MSVLPVGLVLTLYDCETVIGGDVIVNSIVVLLVLLVLSTYVCPLGLLPTHTCSHMSAHLFTQVRQLLCTYATHTCVLLATTVWGVSQIVPPVWHDQ